MDRKLSVSVKNNNRVVGKNRLRYSFAMASFRTKYAGKFESKDGKMKRARKTRKDIYAVVVNQKRRNVKGKIRTIRHFDSDKRAQHNVFKKCLNLH